MNIYTYDLETYKNCFLFIGKFENSTDVQVFEISSRRNDRTPLLQFLSYLKNADAIMQGFNNLAFDYPIIETLLNEPTFTAFTAYQKAQEIFSQQYGKGINLTYWKDREIKQLDLSKVHHFDNAARRTRLKDLEFAMRSDSIEDLPFDPHNDLTFEQMDQLISYGIHDVKETEKFGKRSRHLVVMRQELIDNGVLTGDVLNYSDVKIGEKYLVTKIGRNKCYKGSRPIQTHDHSITHVKDVLLPKIYFRDEKFEAVHDWFKNLTIDVHAETKPKFVTNLAGLEFHYGLGGVHASVESKVFRTTDTHVIKDVDVSGMYVAVAIANGFAPKHLKEYFPPVYKQLQSDRKQFKKGTMMNKTLKDAGNGVYGKSNDVFSPFYDPRYTFTVTCNGQLQLTQLVERFSQIPGLEMIQANTDGITARVPKDLLWMFDIHKTDWENETGLKLEEATYKSMFIRDVNNYVAVYEDGKVKRKGAYWYPETDEEYEGNWHKDHSNMVVPKAASLCMIYDWNPEYVVRCFTDPFDFMIREKAKGETVLKFDDVKLQERTVRFYASTAGGYLTKHAPPTEEAGTYKRKSGLKDSEYKKILASIPPGSWDERIHTKNKSVHKERVNKVLSGYKVKMCNKMENFSWSDVNYSYYIDEVKKLLIEG